MQAVIIAAGQGSRLWPRTSQRPKTLLPFGRDTILDHILGSLHAAGASRYRIVVGFRAEEIEGYLRDHEGWGGRVSFAQNPEWLRGNALSVLRGAHDLMDGEGQVLLSMCDHLVPAAAIRVMIEHPSRRNLLLVDRRVETIFDPDDATKVLVNEDGRIAAIGKELSGYNAVDCGIFRINARMLAAVEANLASGRESISEAARVLIEQDDFEAVDMPDDCSWIDVDTPDAYRHACEHAQRFGAPGEPMG